MVAAQGHENSAGFAPGLRRSALIVVASLAMAACSGSQDSSSPAPPPSDGSDGSLSDCSALYSCTAQAGATEVSITNNCGSASSVSLSIVGTGCDDTVQPTCIQSIATSGTGSVWLLGDNTANNFRVGAFGSSTLFEVTRNQGGQDWYDISQNAGFDVGMTAVPPGGDVPYIVCTSKNCPGAYPFGDTACETNPCLQPNYLAGPTGGTFELYLCNGWTGDPRPAADRNSNTPGPLACSYNQGACISPSDATCPSDQPGHDSRPEDLPCQWGHPVPGQTNGSWGTCPLTCP